MRIEGTTKIPPVAVQCHQRHREELPESKRGRGRREQSPRSSSKGGNPLAFLNEKLEEFPIEGILDEYRIDFEGSYEKIRAGAERFLKSHDLKLSYEPRENEGWQDRLLLLMEDFEKQLEPMDYHCMMHKDDDEPILDAAVYAYGSDMDYTIGELYVRPAETLPPEEAMLFKRFMKLFSSETNIGLGINSDSFFVETQMEYFEGYYDGADLEDMDEEDRKDALFRRAVVANYKPGGKYKALFDEIDHLDVNPSELTKDLQAYLTKYKDKQEKIDEWKLMGVLLNGIDIARCINIYDWTFNPDADGINEDAEEYYYSASSLLNFIFYSEYDTFGESVLDAVNNGAEEMLAWCNHFCITKENNFKKRQEYFEESVTAIPKLRKWLQDFYQTAEKFDTNEYTSRSDEGQD